MDVKQRENATLRNILKNLKELKQRGHLSKIKAKRDEYLRLLKNQETSSLDRLNVIVNKFTKDTSPTLPLDIKTQNLSIGKIARGSQSSTKCEHEIQHNHVDIDPSFVRRLSLNDADLNVSNETANLLKRNDCDVFDLFSLMDFNNDALNLTMVKK
jgi:hypothetical protein